MKRLLTIGLMLVSAFALTNCVEQEMLPDNDKDVIVDESVETENTENEGGLIPFEVYASADESDAETKTENKGNYTKWVDGDAINVYHKNASSYVKHGEFKLYTGSESGTDYCKIGLFTGSLSEKLTAATNDWYFLYPYSSSEDTPTSVSVTIGASASDNYVQTQTGADKRDHIAGAKCPMYGKTTGVSKVQSPKVHMKHLSALVAIKLVNETGNPVTIEHLALVADTNPIVGTFTVDFTESTPSVKAKSTSETSTTANLLLKQDKDTPGITIPVGGNQKFYMAVAPVKDSFTIYVNGTAIAYDSDIELKSGRVTTMSVKLPDLQGTLTSQTAKKDGTEFITWDSNTSTTQASINGQTGITVYSVDNGVITIGGTLEAFLGKMTDDCALPISFYAASKVKVSEGVLATEQARIDISSVRAYKHIKITVLGFLTLIDKTIDMSFSGADLSAKLDGIPTGFDLGKVGLFKDVNSNIISIDESLNNYYLSETKANGLLGRAVDDFTIQDLRDAIFNNSEEAWIKIVNLAKTLAPGQFSVADGGNAKETSSLGSLLLIMVGDYGRLARPLASSQLKTAELTVKLKTTGDVALWGMNVQSEDVDIN